LQDFRELKVWQRAHQFTLAIYKTTQLFPKEELYGLTSQIRRACASIPANLAEGCGKQGAIDFAHYAQISMGSATELAYHLILAHDLNYIDDTQYNTLSSELDEIRRMLYSFLRRLRTKPVTSVE
jgi:four helix bundle protein